MESSGFSDISRKYLTNPQSNKCYLAQLRLPMGLFQPVSVFEIQRLQKRKHVEWERDMDLN